MCCRKDDGLGCDSTLARKIASAAAMTAEEIHEASFRMWVRPSVLLAPVSENVALWQASVTDAIFAVRNVDFISLCLDVFTASIQICGISDNQI